MNAQRGKRPSRRVTKTTTRVGSRAARYVARSSWKATRAAATWSGRHGGQMLVRTAKSVTGPVSTSVRKWSQDRAQFGWQPVFACDCGERVPAHLQAQHLAEHTAVPAPRPVSPSGDKVLAAQERRRRVWAHIEVIRPEDAMPEPGVKEIACRCGQWVGHRAHYPRHAQVCADVGELRDRRWMENQVWLRANRPELTDPDFKQIQTRPAATVVAGKPSREMVVMQDPKGWATSSSVLAEPAIEQDNFREEVPTFLEQVRDGFDPLMEHFSGLSEYLTAAAFDDTRNTQGHIDDAISALASARDAIGAAHNSAVEYIASLSGPHFDRV
jgi:hypothetical protein